MSLEIRSADKDDEVEGIPTGLPQLDRIIGSCAGIPRGRITVLSGKFSVGKSTLALTIVGEAQKMGITCLWADTEMTFSKEHAQMCGVDTKKLLLVRQETVAEEILDTLEEYITKNKNVFVVLDSYSGLSIKDEVEKDAGGADFGAKAKMMARFFRKIKTPLHLGNSTFLTMSHEYDRMGGPGTVLAGGDGMQKSPSLWIKMAPAFKDRYVLKGDERVSEVIVAKIEKTKMGRRFGECRMEFMYGKGFNRVAGILEEAIERGVITKDGNTFYLGEEKLGTKGKVRTMMENPEFVESLKAKL